MHEEMLTYGLKKGTEREMLNIDSVANGLKCGCVCPHCGEDLEACQGDIRQHFFRHASGTECKGARMTALHMLAQNILKREKKVMLPRYEGRYREKFVKAALRKFDRVELEEVCKDEKTRLRPDCVGYNDDKGGNLWIEIFCTNSVDDEKKADIIRREQYCIEIDFSDLLYSDYNEETVRTRLLDAEYGAWICCPKWDKEDEEKHNQKEEEKRLQKEKEDMLEAERLKREQEKKDRNEYLDRLVTEWKFFPNQQNTDKIIEEIESGQKPHVDMPYPQIFDFLVPSKQWRSAITKFPKNELGLQVFYRLLRYYKVYDLTSELEKVMWSLLQEESLSPDSKVLEEYRMALCVLGSIYTHRPLTSDDCSLARKFAENATIREEIYRILKMGKERDCLNYIDVRKKVENYYRDKNYGDAILRIFRICFPDSEIKKYSTSRYVDSFDLSKEKPAENLSLFE